MVASKSLIVVFFCLFCTFLSLPLGHAEVVYNTPPPVEKAKPIEKKSKKSNRAKRKKKFRKKQQAPKHPQKTKSIGGLLAALTIIFMALLIIGAFLFGFGIYLFPLWLIGLIFVGVSNLGILVLALSALGIEEGGWDVAGPLIIIMVFMPILDFIIGLSFLIYGLVIAVSMAWILGLILLGLVLIAILVMVILLRDI